MGERKETSVTPSCFLGESVETENPIAVSIESLSHKIRSGNMTGSRYCVIPASVFQYSFPAMLISSLFVCFLSVTNGNSVAGRENF